MTRQVSYFPHIDQLASPDHWKAKKETAAICRARLNAKMWKGSGELNGENIELLRFPKFTNRH